jgi:exonuclease III
VARVTSFLVLGFTDIRVCTWNTRALLHTVPKAAKLKLKALRGILARHDIVALQETRGTLEETMRLAHLFRSQFRAFFSPGPARDTGGLITFVWLTYIPGNSTVEHHIWALGRVDHIVI